MPASAPPFPAMLGQAWNFLTASPYGFIIIIFAALLLVLLILIPVLRKLRRRSIKKKETGDIMKDLLTWRHLAQLVKGGEEHDKAKQELSDNIVRINELLKEGFIHAGRDPKNPYGIPWYVVLGEPRSGKSSLLAASELELVPSAVEDNPQEDPKQSLPVRIWTGAKAVVCDISGKVFFDRWLEDSSAEWNYIARQLCRRGRRVLAGVILTIPADALLVDDENLSSRKAILMANELGKLLRESGMKLPCHLAVTKLDMVSGFQEYSRAFTGDLRHQILGFESDSKFFHEETFQQFWSTLVERLRSGAKQLLFPLSPEGGADEVSRMDRAGKIWLFPDNFSRLYKNLTVYLDILFGEDNFHGTKNTFFEGAYFTSAKDLGFSFSPDIALLAGRNTEDLPIPVTASPPEENTAAFDAGQAENPGAAATALVAVNASRTLIAPYLRKVNLLRGCFIRDFLHQRVFVPSPHAELIRTEALRRHIPYYALCAAFISLGGIWLSSAIFKANELRASLLQAESYYDWLDGILRKGTPFRSPLIKAGQDNQFTLDNQPVEGEELSSRLRFYYDAIVYRDSPVAAPFGFKCSEALVFRFDRSMGYREKAFIANQLHKSMVRIPVIKNVGAKLLEGVDVQVLDGESRAVIASFVSLDHVAGVDFYRFFTAHHFKLDSMIRYLIPDISNDAMEFLKDYKGAYDRSSAFQIDVDYIYSGAYKRAKQAALDTMLSAWKRRDVYPDSIYGKIRSLAAISENITSNYQDITAALNRVNNVSSTAGVEEAVYEWETLTDRHKSLAARGRAVFEEVRLLLRAAHIPLSFETSAGAAGGTGKPSGGEGAEALTGLLKRPVLDAFGNNLINDYLFNDMVISHAVREYTRLFDGDMEFIKRESGSGALGGVIAEQNTFGGDLNGEVEDLRRRARTLQNNELLSQKTDDKPGAQSLFMTVERILNLASAIPAPERDTLEAAKFEARWQQGQNNIKTALDAFEVFVKPYLENERLSVFIANARIMLLAEAYYNRYVIFTTSLAFLDTFEGNIAAVIEARSSGGEPAGDDLFSFSGNTIAALFGGFSYNRGYDPLTVAPILADVAAFASLFKTGEEAKDAPLFLRNVDPRMYQPAAFMDYLGSYTAYWGNYPAGVYVSAGSWERFKSRAAQYKSFQINSVLLSIHVKCLEFLNALDAAPLNNSLKELKNKYTASLGDKTALLNQFLSAGAEKMFLAWADLPADPLEAYRMLRTASEEDLKTSYLAIYTAADTAGIDWWNHFAIDGVSILARQADAANTAQLMANMDRYKAYPLSADAPRDRPLSLDTVQEIASLLEAMGAALPPGGENPDPVKNALHHSLFGGTAVQEWALRIYQIAAAITDTQKPLSWTAYQVPAETQSRLTGRGRLLAIDRFRYVEVSAAGGSPRMTSTYMNEKQPLLQGGVGDEGNTITLKFFKTSRDITPGAVMAVNSRWPVFEFYLRNDYAVDDQGNRYIPIYLEDEAGRYVYYMGLEFNVELPPPSAWYSSRNWPDLTISGGMITGK